MSDGRGGRPDYFGVDGWLRCGCDGRMHYVDDPMGREDGWDESYAYCERCDHHYDARARMMRADPVDNPWGWESMIRTCLAEGLLFAGMGRDDPFVRRDPVNACLVAFHIMALEAQQHGSRKP